MTSEHSVHISQSGPLAEDIRQALAKVSPDESLLRLDLLKIIERRIDKVKERGLDMATFFDLWQSLVFVGTFDACLLEQSAKKHRIPLECFQNWGQHVYGRVGELLHVGFIWFLEDALQLAKEEQRSRLLNVVAATQSGKPH